MKVVWLLGSVLLPWTGESCFERGDPVKTWIFGLLTRGCSLPRTTKANQLLRAQYRLRMRMAPHGNVG